MKNPLLAHAIALRYGLLWLLLAHLLGCSPSTSDANGVIGITIDQAQTYQTIQGFGGFGAEKVWWADEPFYTQEFVDLLINDLGLTILRDNLPIGFEPENDNADPYLIDWSGFNYSDHYPGADSHLGEHFPYLKAMHEAGLEKLIVSIWSPPIWMKHNDHRGNGSDTIERRTSAPRYLDDPENDTNQLRTELYEEFAEYCVAYIRLLKRETGIDLYAISLQNEPRFSQFYASAIHSPESLRDLIKIVGARFERENLSTKIFMPEDVQSFDAVERYLKAVFDDAEARRHADIVAIHNYRSDGIQHSDPAPTKWRKTAEIAQAYNKETWMTETSGFDPDSFESGLALAKSIYNALRYGQVSAWVYWQMSGKDLIKASGEKTYLYYISQQFYRHIPPGTKRIELEIENEQLFGVAFKHPETSQLSLILINDSPQPRKILLTGAFMEENSIENSQDSLQFEVYLSSPSMFHRKLEQPVSSSESMEIPAQSVVSLVSRVTSE